MVQEIVSFSIPTPNKVDENLQGEGGLKYQNFIGKYLAKLEFPEWRRGVGVILFFLEQHITALRKVNLNKAVNYVCIR